jgi:hypothetical protein
VHGFDEQSLELDDGQVGAFFASPKTLPIRTPMNGASGSGGK